MQPEKLLTLTKKVATYIFPINNCPLKTDIIGYTTHAVFGIIKPQITNATLAMVHESTLSLIRKVANQKQYLEEFGSEVVMNFAGENPTCEITANVASKLFPLTFSLKPGLRMTSTYTQSVAPVAAVKECNVETISGLAGKILRVGSKTYTFVSGSPSGDQIQIGADVAETETNIQVKISADSLYTKATAAIVSSKVRATATTAGIDFTWETDAPALLTLTIVTANTEEVGSTELLEEYDGSYVPAAYSGAIVGEDQNGNKEIAIIPKLILPADLNDDFKYNAIKKGNLTFEGSMEGTRDDGTRVTYFKRSIAPFKVALL